MDPDEDSDNSSVYVQGLNDNVTLEDLADFFKQCGVVKVRGARVQRLAWGWWAVGERGGPPPPCLHVAHLPLARHFQELAGLGLVGRYDGCSLTSTC